MTEDPKFNYCEYITFKDMQFVESRRQHGPMIDCETNYKQLIHKLTKDGIQALVCIRTSDHLLVKCQGVNLEEEKVKRLIPDLNLGTPTSKVGEDGLTPPLRVKTKNLPMKGGF